MSFQRTSNPVAALIHLLRPKVTTARPSIRRSLQLWKNHPKSLRGTDVPIVIAICLGATASPARADTEAQVWNTWAQMSGQSYTANPLEGERYTSHSDALDAVKAANSDGKFLEVVDRIVTSNQIRTEYAIAGKQGIAEPEAWSYSAVDSAVPGSFASEGGVTGTALDIRDQCGNGSITPASAWSVISSSPAEDLDRRYYTLIVSTKTYDHTENEYTCDPYVLTTTNNYEIRRIREKNCPAAAPWHGSEPDGNDVCRNTLEAAIVETKPKMACEAEGDDVDPLEGNPCDVSTGNKIEKEVDYVGPGIRFERTYNSMDHMNAGEGHGDGWTHNYASRIELNGTTPLYWRRGDGQIEKLWYVYDGGAGIYVGERSAVQVVANGTEWDLHKKDGSIERYSDVGLLLWVEDAAGLRTTLTYNGNLDKVTGPFGHEISFSYFADGLFPGSPEEKRTRIQKITLPDNEEISFEYALHGITKVTYADGQERVYHYEDANRDYLLTGITDENNDRYSTFAYDTQGRVTSSEHAGGQEKVTLAYTGDTTTVTDAEGNIRTYNLTSTAWSGWYGNRRIGSVSRAGNSASRTYTQGYSPHRPLTSVDDNGVTTAFTYDTITYKRLSMTEASGTSDARTTSYQYLNSKRHLPTVVTTPSVYSSQNRTVTTAYNVDELPTSVTIAGYTPSGTAVSRAITLGYNTAGQVTSIDGPLAGTGDTTTLDYYDCTTGAECGQLESVTNALGHVTDYDSYDDNGRLTQMTDPNGLVTTYTYDLRGRVLTQVQTPPTGPTRTTTYTYDDVGQLETVTAPNGTILTYAYDAAHQLTSVTDNSGNKIEYGYDLNGNLTDEDIKDSSSTLKSTVDSTYDARDRIDTINSAGSITDLVFDAVGNLTDETDPNSNDTDHTYDSLNRLTQTLDALSGTTTYDYDVNDALTSVTAPNGANTTYSYDDLGNLVSMTSPDTGTTTYTYDAAGNRLTQTDANSVTTTYTYDNAYRLATISYPDTTLNVTLTYDGGTNQKGRLTAMTDASGSSTLSYDVFGNLTQEAKTVGSNTHTTSYTYDAANLLTQITYPSGRVVDYTRNVLGQVTQVATTYNSVTQTVASSVGYEPFGPLNALTFGNGLVLSRTFDQQYRLTDQVTAGGGVTAQDLTFTLDAASNIDAIADAVDTTLNQTFAQDVLHRITQDVGSYGTKDFTYDGVGNRLTRVFNDGSTTVTQTLTYTTNSNKLATHDGNSVTIDSAGNTTADTVQSLAFTYGDHNRMATASVGGVQQASYTYNGQGQRIKKVESTGSLRTFVFHYGLNGELIGESVYDSVGNLVEERDYVWLDSLPLAQSERAFSGSTITSSSFVYIHGDQLNTPRLATDSTKTTVWRWDSDAFGEGQADMDPDADLTLVNVRLRFPGQYYDEETSLHYNYFRDYDPVVGRYVESDPIGLYGGLGTYTYALNNSVVHTDSQGLAVDTLADLGFIGYDIYRIFKDNVVGDCDNLGENLAALGADVAGFFTPFGTGFGLGVRASQGARKHTTVIGRTDDLKNLKDGEKSLLDRLPNQGSPKANWKQNAGVLRQEMRRGNPIRDASPGDNSGQFLNAERALLRDRGWTFDPSTNLWMPPKTP